MEKTVSKSTDLLNQINRIANKEFLKEIYFITYLLKKNPFNDDLEEAKMWWFESDNFVEDYRKTINFLLEYSEKKDETLHELIIDADGLLSFYLNGNFTRIPVFSELIRNLLDVISIEELKEQLMKCLFDERSRDMSATSSSIVELTKQLLSVKQNDAVLDLCCGKGKLLNSINESNDLTGVEINNDCLKDAYLACLISDKNPKILHQDALTYKGGEFDKIFCEYPWGYIYDHPLQSLGCEKWKPLAIKDIKRSMTSWLFIAKVLSLLKRNGVAVVHCNDGALFSTYEREVRKLAIEKGLVKGVISLPRKMYLAANITTSLLILSMGNKSVRFVDASSFGAVNSITKTTYLKEEEIEKIISLFNSEEDGDFAVTVKNENIEESYLNVSKFLKPNVAPVRNRQGKKLEDVIEDLIKSVVSNSSYLTNDSASGIKVLSSSDIKDGAVDVAKLPYLSEEAIELLPKNWEKSVLNSGDVIMTNKSTVIKSAIVEINDEKVILFGSLYGIRLKKDVMVPIYLCSFINSNAGQMLLKTIQTGTVISMITSANLKDLVVPCPSIPDQIKLCEDISITLEMIRESRERILKLQKTYESSFDELLTEE